MRLLQRCLEPQKIVIFFLIFCTTFSAAAGSVSAVECAKGFSALDCEALLNGWTNWVPDTCSGTGGGTLVGNDNIQKLFNFFVSNGFTAPQAAGIAGNVMIESGGDPEISQLDHKDYQNPPQPGNGQIGWGIVQWTPADKITNGSPLSGAPYLLSTQLQFLLDQLNGKTTSPEKTAGEQLKQVTTGITTTSAPPGYQAGPQSVAWHASQVFLQYYERAADHAPEGLNAYARGTWADKVLAQYGGSAPTGTSGASACSSGVGISGTCNTPAPTGGYDAVKAALFSQFKIILIGATDADWATQTYNTMCALAKAPAYFSRLLAAGPINVDLVEDGGCGAGYAQSSTLLHVHGPCADPAKNRFVLTHESGHVFSMRNGDVWGKFVKELWGGADPTIQLPGPAHPPAPGSPPTLPTLNCQHDYDGNGGHGPYSGECWADMIGEYDVWFDLEYEGSYKGLVDKDFKQYQSQYSAYYDFARDNLFGGVEYTSL